MQSVILGNAKWGLAYGATTPHGRLTDEAVPAIANVAHAQGLRRLDTTAVSGDVEARVGRLVPGFAVQTKVSASGRHAVQTRESVSASPTTLEWTSLDALLVHYWASHDSDERDRVASALEGPQRHDVATAVGIPSYVEGEVPSVGCVPLTRSGPPAGQRPGPATHRITGVGTQPVGVDWPSLALSDPWLVDHRSWTAPTREG